MARTKNPEHYVDNKIFTAALDDYSRKCRASIEIDINRTDPNFPRMTRYIGECIIKMANRLASRPNFCNYTYREEMVLDAIELSMRYSYRFNGDKYDNAFAYVTQIMFSAMVQRIKKEKKKQELNYRLIQDADHMMFLHGEAGPSEYQAKARKIADQKLNEMEEQKAISKKGTGVQRKTTTRRRKKNEK